MTATGYLPTFCRLMFGNGLRAEIWEEFVSRFHIQDIAEFYGKYQTSV